MKLGAGALLAAAVVLTTLAILGADETRDGPSGDGDEAARADFPVPLHTDPGGDVSRAFVSPAGKRVIINAVNMFPVVEGRQTWAQSDYDAIASRGFTGVRFLLTWSAFEPEPGRFRHLEQIDEAVRRARNAGLYVVMLNMIIDPWNSPPEWAAGSDKLEQIARSGKAWTQELARRYENEDAVAAYDLAAELPSNDQNRNLVLYDKLISWVRQVDTEKIVITTAGWGNNEMSPARVDPAPLADEENVVHSFHDYYAGDGNPDSASVGYNEYGMNAGNQISHGDSGYPEPDDEEDFAAQLAHHAAYARRAGVALWIGEYGISPAAENADRWVAQKAELYDRHGIGRAWWLYTCGEPFSLKDASCNWLPIVDALT